MKLAKQLRYERERKLASLAKLVIDDMKVRLINQAQTAGEGQTISLRMQVRQEFAPVRQIVIDYFQNEGIAVECADDDRTYTINHVL